LKRRVEGVGCVRVVVVADAALVNVDKIEAYHYAKNTI
jgi:hypothetical protein